MGRMKDKDKNDDNGKMFNVAHVIQAGSITEALEMVKKIIQDEVEQNKQEGKQGASKNPQSYEDIEDYIFTSGFQDIIAASVATTMIKTNNNISVLLEQVQDVSKVMASLHMTIAESIALLAFLLEQVVREVTSKVEDKLS